ncbi:response regulator [Patescibacteria group bacterium]|nr:response regulator [Patescibacteria group bacterium]
MKHVARAAEDVGFSSDSITIAQSASAARGLIQQCAAGSIAPPEIAICDPHLTPGQDRLEDGFDVMEELKEMAPGCTVIVLTCRGDTKNTLGARGITRGAKDYVDMSWAYVNWYEFLKQRLELWKGVRAKTA